MSAEQAPKEKFGFQAEVKQVLHLMIHSLYSNKEIFLRELISNASDAADKLRFFAIKYPQLLTEESELKIWVEFNKDARTITVRDNGIGMNREEVIQNLGTIAKSGTREFLNRLTGDRAKDAQLIGQFGVGFYSAFTIADKVEVITRKAGSKSTDAVRWTSNGEGEYEVETLSKEKRGTEVILHLKPEEDEFLNDWRLKHIIKKYSDHISLPIVMKAEKPIIDEKAGEKEAKEEKGKKAETEQEEVVVNKAQALWVQPKNEITEEQYKELYKHVAHDFEDPLIWSHNKVEGKLEYTTLLFIPARAPFDLWQINKPRGLKLYVRRVFIMDDAEQFLPHYLRFVRGVIDSNDLPLNISREVLQSNRVIDAIRTAVVKRVLGMLEQMAKEDPAKFQKFWKEFGQVLKEGPAEDFANREQIAKLLRFASTKTDFEEETVSLEDYVTRMQSDQDKIYYVTADSFNAAKNSPHLEIFRKKNIEVLLLSNRVDEWLVTHLNDFQGKELHSVARGTLDLDKEVKDTAQEEYFKQAEASFADVLTKMKDLLKEKVKDIRLSKRLTSSPSCIVVDEKDLSSQMERILKAAGQKIVDHKPILELNPDHFMVQRLKSELNKPRFSDWSNILLDQAVLSEGGQLNDPAGFVKQMNSILGELAQGK